MVKKRALASATMDRVELAVLGAILDGLGALRERTSGDKVREEMMFQKSQDILGKVVVNESGVVIGEVNDYVINTTTWQVTDLQVKIEKKKAKELGLKTPFFGSLLVLIEVHVISSLTDQVILSLDAGGFKAYVEDRKAAAEQEERDNKKKG